MTRAPPFEMVRPHSVQKAWFNRRISHVIFMNQRRKTEEEEEE